MIVVIEDVINVKLYFELVEKVLKLLDVKFEEVLMVGDNYYDIVSG